MFFYETHLEVVLSVLVGLQYTAEHQQNPESDKYKTTNLRNEDTREIHRILLFVFIALSLVFYVTVIVIMTRKSEVMKRWEDKFGSLYEDLNYSENGC